MTTSGEKEAGNIVSVNIPSEVFKDRSISVLEAMVEYLKDRKELSFHEIAVLLNRNDRTIWTVYHRTQQKRRAQGKYVKEIKGAGS
ncbi:hypothetical protein JW968_05555 [Candidatus Woesearchaeota archaeon]|nr:hypothetical protein [Candidatus Woesearchaeota archaeon]